MAISRREALALSGLVLASSTLSANPETKSKKKAKNNSLTDYKAPLPDTKNPRVVVVGGGWSGLSIAKYTKIFAPRADVILVEQRHQFIS